MTARHRASLTVPERVAVVGWVVSILWFGYHGLFCPVCNPRRRA